MNDDFGNIFSFSKRKEMKEQKRPDTVDKQSGIYGKRSPIQKNKVEQSSNPFPKLKWTLIKGYLPGYWYTVTCDELISNNDDDFDPEPFLPLVG